MGVACPRPGSWAENMSLEARQSTPLPTANLLGTSIRHRLFDPPTFASSHPRYATTKPGRCYHGTTSAGSLR